MPSPRARLNPRWTDGWPGEARRLVRQVRQAAGGTRRYLPLAGLPATQRRARVVTACGAGLTATVLATAPLVAGKGYPLVQAALAAVGLLLLLVALAGWRAGIGWSVAFLAAEYGVGLVGRKTIDPAAPVEAAGLLLVAELAVWSLESRTMASDRPGQLGWRVRRLALLEAVALSSGSAVLATANMPAHGGTTLGAVGVASAVAVLVLAALALRWVRRPDA